MKTLIILFIISLPVFVEAQVSNAVKENALYQLNTYNLTAHYIEVRKDDSMDFSKEEYDIIHRLAMEKEGVFEVELVNNNQAVRLAHLSYVDVATIKSFFSPITLNITVSALTDYTF